MNVITLLKQQHQQLRTVMDKLAQLADTDSDKRDDYFQQFKALFRLHDDIEDKIVYPAFREQKPLEKMILKSYQAHHMAEVGILELKMVPYNTETWAPKFLVVRDSILQHMSEEENDVFPKAEKALSPEELNRLGERAKELVAEKETA